MLCFSFVIRNFLSLIMLEFNDILEYEQKYKSFVNNSVWPEAVGGDNGGAAEISELFDSARSIAASHRH